MIHSLHIEGYRSLADFSLKLAPLTVVQGGNGVGKSNLYKALRLFGSLSQGNFPQAMVAEGGTESCLWAGPKIGPPQPKRVCLDLKAVDFRWKLAFGLVPTGPDDPTMFRGDPEVKKEMVSGGKEQYSRAQWAGEVSHNESIVSYIRDSERYRLMSLVREEIDSWRFYDDFRHDADSPLRKPSARVWSPVLSESGDNLAAAIQTIDESGGRAFLREMIGLGFPEHVLSIGGSGSQLEIQWQQPDLSRPTKGSELSDGTLQFLALCAALLSPKPPGLLVLNEPENSLNPILFPALVALISRAAESSQILVITHSGELSSSLVEQLGASLRKLAIQKGATRFEEDLGPRRVWNFED